MTPARGKHFVRVPEPSGLYQVYAENPAIGTRDVGPTWKSATAAPDYAKTCDEDALRVYPRPEQAPCAVRKVN